MSHCCEALSATLRDTRRQTGSTSSRQLANVSLVIFRAGRGRRKYLSCSQALLPLWDQRRFGDPRGGVMMTLDAAAAELASMMARD